MIAQLLEQAKVQQHSFYLAVLRIENLDQINEQHGLDAVGATLKQVSHRLRQGLNPATVVARWHGTNFAIGFLEAAKAKLLERLQPLCATPPSVQIGPAQEITLEITLELQIGVAQFPQAGNSLSRLYTSADQALARRLSPGAVPLEMTIPRG